MNELDVLAKDVGIWDAVIEVLAGPAPSTSKGTMTSRRTCGGKWLVSDYVGDSGFSGHGMWTWDASQQRYTGVWADEMMTFLAPGEGTWDGRTMTYVYQGRGMRWRQTTESVDEDTRVFLSFVPETAEQPVMKATYRRRR